MSVLQNKKKTCNQYLICNRYDQFIVRDRGKMDIKSSSI